MRHSLRISILFFVCLSLSLSRLSNRLNDILPRSFCCNSIRSKHPGAGQQLCRDANSSWNIISCPSENNNKNSCKRSATVAGKRKDFKFFLYSFWFAKKKERKFSFKLTSENPFRFCVLFFFFVFLLFKENFGRGHTAIRVCVCA